jgi:hypothetical protein
MVRVRAACLGLLAAAASFTAVALASNDETITASEPQPGGTLSGASQSIGGSKGATVSVTGDLRDTTVVLEGGARVSKQSADRGNAVAACWLAGPQAIKVKNDKVREWLASDDVRDLLREKPGAGDVLIACMSLVKFIANRIGDEPSGRAAAGCQAAPVNLRFRRRNGRTVLSLATQRQGPTTRYRCKKVAGGIAMSARDKNGKPLKGALGAKLDFGLYKTTKGPPSAGKLKLRFQLR